MTFQEIIQKFKDANISVEEFAYSQYSTENDLKEGIPEWKEVEKYGGEGQGDTWYSVKYFPEYNIYMKVSGWYQSYDDTEFGDWESACKQVFPQQKTITVYEPVYS